MFWFSLIKKDNEVSQITYDDIKWNGKKVRCRLDQIGLGELLRNTYYMDSVGIVGV